MEPRLTLIVLLKLIFTCHSRLFISSNKQFLNSSAVAEMGDCGQNRHRPKGGGLLCPFCGGELGPHLTQCRLGWGLPPYQVASWSIQPFGQNRYGPKIGGSAPFCGRGSWVPIWHNVARAEAYLHSKFHLDPSNRLAIGHQRCRQDRTGQDRQTTVW